jgi:hypothetical protein
MKIISLNMGLPRRVQWKGKVVSTGICKTQSVNFDGDRQPPASCWRHALCCRRDGPDASSEAP